MCTIQGLSASQVCGEADGGVKACYVAEFANLSFTIGSKKVTAITGALKKFVFTKNNTAFFNSTGERQTLSVHRYQQEGLMQFNQTDAATEAADEIKACCKLVPIWLLENGNIRIQGVQFTSSAKTALEVSAVECRAIASDLSDVGGQESRVEIKFTSQSKNTVIVNTASINEAYLDALVA